MGKALTEILVRLPDQSEHRYVLEPGEYLVGRDPECQIRVDSPEVSRRHARLEIGEEDLRFKDLGSNNGSMIGGERVSGSIRLRLPQRIQLGGAELEIKRFGGEAKASVAPPAAPAPGEKFFPTRGEEYTVGALLGQGGMGAVLAAVDIKVRRQVAMKRLRLGRAASRESQMRFLQEARVLGQLEHPNIVPLYDLDLDAEGEVFYTMKLVKGVTLHQVLGEIKAGRTETVAKYPLAQLLTILQKVSDAVSFAHSKGIIHRDLKPENIMLGDFGEVLVMDWGLAKILQSELGRGGESPATIEGFQETKSLAAGTPALQTMEGKVMGTPNFMAPEQAEGRIGDIDARTDVFALGGILYNLLTLRAPAAGATAAEVMDKIKRGHILPPVYYNQPGALEPDGSKRDSPVVLAHCPGGKIPEALSAVAMKALAHDPAARYQSVAEFQKDIAAYQGGFATSAEAAGVIRQAVLWTKRHKTMSIASAVILISAVAFVTKQTLTLRELRGTAPTFYTLARSLMDDQKFDGALEKLAYALVLAPGNADYYLLKGHILQASLRLEEAKTAYAHALKLRSGDPLAEQNFQLCDKLIQAKGNAKELSPASFQDLQLAVSQQGRSAEALALASRSGKGSQKMLAAWRARLEKAGVQVGDHLTLDEQGHMELTWNGWPVADLSPLRGLPLSKLNLLDSELGAMTDLSPLKGMPLNYLRLRGLRAVEFTVLRGLPLTSLSLSAAQIEDLTPLRGLPLRELTLGGCGNVRDLAPLKGLLLETLDISGTKVTDLSPVKGMPLRRLDVSWKALTDFSPLAGLPLTWLSLNGTVISDLEPLRDLKLTHLMLGSTKVKDLRPLAAMRLNSLDLRDTSVADVRPLAGMPLVELDLSGTRVAELSPLHGMPLFHLGLAETPVVDLAPLIGMPLGTLDLRDTQVVDLAPLTDFSIKSLTLTGCKNLRDLKPLASCAKLERLGLPAQCRDIEFLRKLPSLSFISYTSNEYGEVHQSAADFWKEFDARNK